MCRSVVPDIVHTVVTAFEEIVTSQTHTPCSKTYNTMIYTAIATKGTAGQHMAFSNRGIQNLTQDRMSNISLHSRPDKHQLAYDGYKANIEAFLGATADKVKKSTINTAYPLPLIPEFACIPLPLPKVVFRLARKPTPAQLKKMEDNLGPHGLEMMALGKGDPVYLLKRPTFDILTRVLPAIATPNSPNVEGYCSPESAFWACKFHVIISLFLMVHTYPYSRADDEDAMDEDGAPAIRGIKRMTIAGEGSANVFRKKLRMEGFKIRDEDGDELDDGNDYILEEDEEDAHSLRLAIDEAVMSAKPSPFDVSINCGSPSEVPNLPGLLFPYFHGITAPDPNFMRIFCINYFFRNLGDIGQNPRDAYKALRSAISPFAHTPEGVAIVHIFKGIELALEAQCVCYILMDKDVYLGFCLLGKGFQVFAHGGWVKPMEASKLRKDLDTILTHDNVIEKIYTLTKGWPKLRGCVMGKVGDIKTSLGLLQELAKNDFTKVDEREDSEDLYDQLESHLKRLSFGDKYKRFSPVDLAWAVSEMTEHLNRPLPDDTPVYIPTTQYHLMGRKEYQVLLSFGPRSPSFRMTSGSEYRIPKEINVKGDPFIEKQAKDEKKFVIDKLLIGEKLPHVALQEWDQVVRTGKVRFEPNERAGASRAHCFRGDPREQIWKSLAKGVECGVLGGKAAVASDEGKASTSAGGFTGGSIDDIF
jgi:hypothetical protein